MVNLLSSSLVYNILSGISVFIIILSMLWIIFILHELIECEDYYFYKRKERNKKIFQIFLCVFIFIIILIFQFIISIKRDEIIGAKSNENIINNNDKFDFIEREFHKQVKHQLKDMNIIIFLDDVYSGEYEDRFIEMKGSEYGLYLKNTIFYDKKVIYEFIHSSNN